MELLRNIDPNPACILKNQNNLILPIQTLLQLITKKKLLIIFQFISNNQEVNHRVNVGIYALKVACIFCKQNLEKSDSE